jgi:hypothetical protein
MTINRKRRVVDKRKKRGDVSITEEDDAAKDITRQVRLESEATGEVFGTLVNLRC